jgi:hypothetical protein
MSLPVSVRTKIMRLATIGASRIGDLMSILPKIEPS